MKYILLFITPLVFTNLVGLNLTSVYPAYMNYDSNPYVVTSALSNLQLNLLVNISSQTDVYLNSVFSSNISQSGSISLNLSLGYNTISFVDAISLTNFIVPVSTTNNTQHNVTLGTTNCLPFDCGNTSVSSVNLSVKAIGYSARIFSIDQRQNPWIPVSNSSSILFSLVTGYNYLQIIVNNTCAMTYKIYKIPSTSMAIGIQISGTNAFLVPRFSPDIYSYQVSPYFDSSTGFTYALTVNSYTPCSITYSSSSGQWTDITLSSEGTTPMLTLYYPGDLVIIKSKDTAGNIIYYYLTLNTKNKNRYLQELQIYNQPNTSALSTYTDINQCCNLTQITLLQTFNYLVNNYNTSELNYTNQSFTYILIPQDTSAQVLLNERDYLSNTKVITPSIGNNLAVITVIAEDPGFNSTYTVSFYMKNNISSLSQIFSNFTLQPLFNSSILVYHLNADYYQNKIPFTFIATDPKAIIMLNVSNNLSTSVSYLNTTLNFTVVTLTIYLTVIAETPSLLTTYSIILFKNDTCGNGLRYTTEEQCDDGNTNNRDGCSSVCKVESG